MNPELAFLWSIKEAPDDDGLRLVFADWLEDSGQPERAELIRLQVEAARLPAGLPRRDALERRAAELLAEHGPRWLGPWAGEGEFRRGLLHVRCEAGRLAGLLAAGGEEALAWVEGLRLQGRWKRIRPLLSGPWLRHLASLDLRCNGIGDAGAAALAGSPHLANLTSLYLIGNGIGAAAALAALAASPHLANLTSLGLGNNGIGAAGAAALAASPHLARLTSLELSWNGIGEAGAAALAASPHLARLTDLGLWQNGIGDAGAAALAASPHLARLTSLELRSNGIGEGARARLRERYGSACHL